MKTLRQHSRFKGPNGTFYPAEAKYTFFSIQQEKIRIDHKAGHKTSLNKTLRN